ncbi:MAG: hypothetical protein SFU83_22330 [Meiothermus sp.]|nr:hypothetical protein [Meiothermus sp.]
MSKTFDITKEMTLEERLIWVSAGVLLGSAGVYWGVILGRARYIPITEVPYGWAMFWSLGAVVLGSLAVAVATVILAPREADQKDQRDREVGRHGDAAGYNVLALGCLGVLALTVAGAEPFWVAHSLYLCCVVAGLWSAVTKIIAYRRGFSP